jgi:hypothetical protein
MAEMQTSIYMKKAFYKSLGNNGMDFARCKKIACKKTITAKGINI